MHKGILAAVIALSALVVVAEVCNAEEVVIRKSRYERAAEYETKAPAAAVSVASAPAAIPQSSASIKAEIKADIASISAGTTPPVASQKPKQSVCKQYAAPAQADIVAPTKGCDIAILTFDGAKNGKIGTHDAPTYAVVAEKARGMYFLHEMEPVKIGNHGYSFSRTSGGLMINTVRDGKVVSEILPDGKVWFSKDGLMIKKADVGGSI